MNELVARNFGRVPPVHGLQANDALGGVAFTLGNARIRHCVKRSAVGTEEGPAGGNWSCERHTGASVDRASMRPENRKFQHGGAVARIERSEIRVVHATQTIRSSPRKRGVRWTPSCAGVNGERALTRCRSSLLNPNSVPRSRSWSPCAGGRPSAWQMARADRTGPARARRCD